jgi:hypothetical protein
MNSFCLRWAIYYYCNYMDGDSWRSYHPSSELRFEFAFLYLLSVVSSHVAAFVYLLYFPQAYLLVYRTFLITNSVSFCILLVLYLLCGLRLFHTLNEVGMITYNASLKERIESVRKPIKNLLRKVSFYVIVTTI